MPVHCYPDWEDTVLPTCPGRPYPLGAYYDGHGINFALYSGNLLLKFIYVYFDQVMMRNMN